MTKTRTVAPLHIHRPFKTQFRNQVAENIFKEKPSQRSIRLFLHIHNRPRSPHCRAQHSTIQVGHSAGLKSLPATLRAEQGGLSFPGYVPGGPGLCYLGTQSQKAVARSGCHRRWSAISVAGREDPSAKRGLVCSQWPQWLSFCIYSKEAS